MEDLAQILKEKLDEVGAIDVGPGAETVLGVSRSRLVEAIGRLIAIGYKYHRISFVQKHTGKKVTVEVLTKSDVILDWESKGIRIETL